MAHEPGSQLKDTADAGLAAKRKRRHREWVGALLMVFGGTLGLALGRLGNLWPAFDVLSHFFIHSLLMVAAGLVGFVFPRYKGMVAVILFTAMVAAYGLWPQFASRGGESALAANEVRLVVAQFNVHGGSTDPAAIGEVIRKLDADVISVVELDSRMAPMLAALKAVWPYQALCEPGQECDNAILSKVPFSAVTPLPDGKKVASAGVMVTLGPAFGNLNVVAVHTARFPYQGYQRQQLDLLAQQLDGRVGPMLVMGDFNAAPFSWTLRNFSSRLGLSVLTYLPSWPATFGLPQLPIDHILASSDIRALNRETSAPSGGSDHVPVVLTVAVRNP